MGKKTYYKLKIDFFSCVCGSRGVDSCDQDMRYSTELAKYITMTRARSRQSLLPFQHYSPYRRIFLTEFLVVEQFHRLFLNCHWHSSTEAFIPTRTVEISWGFDLQKSSFLWKNGCVFLQTEFGSCCSDVSSDLHWWLNVEWFSNLLSRVVWGLFNRGFL